MPSQKKIELIQQYSQLLKDNPDFILTRYQGINVAKLSELRKELNKTNARYRVVKNNIFKRALSERTDIKDFPADNVFHGPIGVTFVKEDVTVVAKALKKFSGENENFKMISGVMESRYYDEAAMKSVADMPSRDQSLATLASALNSPARNIASLMNQVMSSLARAINAVAEKNK
ncbi:MAG: 50S ribosomal protein L10 [Spirochaetia bacterium]|nr:50S ribosomal protein L10 [Spirochaetia bacterium]